MLLDAFHLFMQEQYGNAQGEAEDRDAAMKFAMNLGCVDAVTIGFKNTAEIDEAIERMNRVMNA